MRLRVTQLTNYVHVQKRKKKKKFCLANLDHPKETDAETLPEKNVVYF